MLINLRNAMMAGKRLPYDAEVEYLESTGTQWIDTGMKMRNNLSFDAVFIPTGNSPGQPYGAIYGVYNSADINVASLSCIVPIDNAGSNYGNRYMDVSKGVPTSNASYKNKLVVYHQANDSFTVSVDGTTYNYGAFASQQIAESTETIMLFGIRSVAFGNRYAKAKLFTFKVYDGSTLVRDFIPVRKGTVGYLYDRVSGKLFGNAGTGDFVLGPDVVPVEYIESHGTEWIDTGFKANTTTTRLDCGIVPINTSTTQGLCGSRNTINLTNDGAANIFVFNGNLRLDWLNGYQGGAQTYAISSGSDYDVSITRGTAVINGTTLTSTNDASIAEDVNFLIGNFTNGTAGPFNTGFIGRWKRAKLFSNGVPVRSFLPVRVGSDATSWEGAMMDVLTRRIHRNAGTGAFGYGNDLKYPIPAS